MPDTEGTVLDDIADLHRAMYNTMAGITGITGLEFRGFDSSITQPAELPQIAMQMRLGTMEIDRRRPTPLEGHRLEIETGTPVTYTVDGEDETVYPEREYQYPLPLNLIYEIDTWCHSAETQLAMDLKIMQTFPERGVLTLTIGSDDFEFPIELVDTQNLDDLSTNLRERLYRFRIQCYVYGWIENTTGKIITSIINEYKEGDDEDYTDLEDTTLEPDA